MRVSVRSLVVVLVAVLFRLPVRHMRRGGCTSAMLVGSMAADLVVLYSVLSSVAGTLGTVLVCTLGDPCVCSVRCSVG